MTRRLLLMALVVAAVNPALAVPGKLDRVGMALVGAAYTAVTGPVARLS